jgi:hypothetical protein
MVFNYFYCRMPKNIRIRGSGSATLFLTDLPSLLPLYLMCRCGHVFCNKCILDSLRTGGGRRSVIQCPLCNADGVNKR